MKLTINGKEEDLPDGEVTISRLLELRNVKMPEMVSVELNGEFIEREHFTATRVRENDRVEFLYFMGGGKPIDPGWDFETKLVHSGVDPAAHNGATSIPIYESASFAYDTAQEMADVFDNRRFGYVYSRISNPTVTAFEQRINALESGTGAVATSSGMAAIAAVVLVLTEQGDEIVSGRSLFGGTFLLFNNVLAKYGITTKYVDATDPDAVRDAITDRTRLVFVETLGNPKLDVPDISVISDIASEHNVPLVVDSTLSTPYLFKAKKHGAHIVIHSTTKYIAGNGSAIGGVIVDTGNYPWKKSPVREVKEIIRKVGPDFPFLAIARRNIVQNVGLCPSPFNAYLHMTGVETLALRMERHCDNALKLARYLPGCSDVTEVNYPGLTDNPFHAIAAKQFRGRFGGLLTFRLGSKERCFRFIDNLKMVLNLANLGDTRTLVIHPASTIYHDCTKEEMEAAGVTDDMLRISVGIESATDIINDFKQALEGTD